MNPKDLFAYLKMEETSDWKKVKSQVRKLLLAYHPDTHQENKHYYEEKTRQILKAYELLRHYFMEKETLPFELEESAPQPEVILPRSFLLFQISNKNFAFPIETVEEVVAGKNFRHEKFFLGRINTRKGEVPVFSLAFLFHLSYHQQPLSEAFSQYLKHIIIVARQNQRAGFLTDTVKEVIELTEKELVATPALPSLEKYLLSVAVRNEKIIFILSVDMLFQSLS